MCELLGMNCNVPTDICFSFTGFRARGGLTDEHQDGWGIAFFEGKGVRQFLDPEPSASSQIAELVRNYPIKSKNVVAHIRKATQGDVALENTHPFIRELWGVYWIFAHNGNLPDFRPALSGRFLPVGTTDSERVFCWIMEGLVRRFGESKPTDRELFEEMRSLATEVGKQGECNFLLSNGEILLAHSSTQLTYIVRKAPFSVARLKDQDVTIDFDAVTSRSDRVAVIATFPLTENESWTTLQPGTLSLLKDGEIMGQCQTAPGPSSLSR